MQHEINASWVIAQLPKRPANAHKGTFGTVGILAGSSRYRGAASLAVAGALRAGAGIVQLCAIEKVCAAVAAQHPCCVLHTVDEINGGLPQNASEEFLQQTHNAILAGCGLGKTSATKKIVANLLEKSSCPLVLDADALNVLVWASDDEKMGLQQLAEKAASMVNQAAAQVVLTPHIGEGARLAGLDIDFVVKNQTKVALQLAKQYGCTVVLKSHETVVATPSGTSYLNKKAGNAGLAKGGSGDVLAGIIVSLLGQGLPPEKAAPVAVWLHAAAADEAAKEHGEMSLLPADIPMHLGRVCQRLSQAQKPISL